MNIGASCSGKSTLALKLVEHLGGTLLAQDQFYKKDEEIPIIDLDGEKVQNWDCPEAIDMEALYLELTRLKESDIVILDGFLIYVDPRILGLIDIKITLSADFDTLLSRRNSRKDYVTKSGYWSDPKDYFEKVVWPQHCQRIWPQEHVIDTGLFSPDQVCERVLTIVQWNK